MHVDAAPWGDLEHRGAEDLPVGNDHDHLRRQGAQRFHELRLAGFFRLEHRQPLLAGQRLDRRDAHRLASAGGAVRLGHDGRHPVAGLQQRPQGRHGEDPGAHENEPHLSRARSRRRRRARALRSRRGPGGTGRSSRVPLPPHP